MNQEKRSFQEVFFRRLKISLWARCFLKSSYNSSALLCWKWKISTELEVMIMNAKTFVYCYLPIINFDRKHTFLMVRLAAHSSYTIAHPRIFHVNFYMFEHLNHFMKTLPKGEVNLDLTWNFLELDLKVPFGFFAKRIGYFKSLWKMILLSKERTTSSHLPLEDLTWYSYNPVTKISPDRKYVFKIFFDIKL